MSGERECIERGELGLQAPYTGRLVLLVRRRAQKKVTDVGGTTPITRNHHPSRGTTPANGLSKGTTPAPSLPTSVTLSASFSIAEASEASVHPLVLSTEV
eukprot:SAG22_NODE_487_length_9870_cov_13.118821_12_plen_100_part_00